jgi:RimJ/RimL family protein N-acetyltransferase
VTEPSAPALEGRLVRLRPPRPEDHALLFEWSNDPDLVAPFDRFAATPWEEFVAELERAPEEPGSLAARFVVERLPGAETIGMVGYYSAHPVLALWDVWYVLGRPSERGKGYGRESVRLLVDHLFATQPLERVGATCDVDNIPSSRLLASLGFRAEGRYRSALYHHARWHDVLVYGVTRSEWRSGPPAPDGS